MKLNLSIVYLSSSSSCCISVLFDVHTLPCTSSYTLPHSFDLTLPSGGIRVTSLSNCNEKQKRLRREGIWLKEKTNKIYYQKMATQFYTNVEIRKFDGKTFTLWKEIMQDVLIIRCQIEAIQHNNKHALMTTEECCSLDKIA